MGEEDIQVLAFAEKCQDANSWRLDVYYEGSCLIGCKSRRLSRTRNLFAVGEWVGYHREGPEHVAALLKRSGGDLSKMPGISGTIVADAPTFDDPTHGRIDKDIQEKVAEMNPKDLGQRVAMENTLQHSRDMSKSSAFGDEVDRTIFKSSNGEETQP